MHECVCVCVCIYIHAYIHIYIHIYAQGRCPPRREECCTFFHGPWAYMYACTRLANKKKKSWSSFTAEERACMALMKVECVRKSHQWSSTQIFHDVPTSLRVELISTVCADGGVLGGPRKKKLEED
jgi:hypothetical protein